MVKQKGFTLLELLIVIGLIGILIAISVTSYTTIQKKSRDSRRMGDLKAVQNALEQYYADYAAYPATDYSTLTTTYLPGGPPSDPKTKCYYKQTLGDTTGYSICADLEGTGTFACSTPCSGVTGAGCADLTDFCITNLQ